MRLYTAAGSLFALFLVPLAASALGLGDISLNSALNEPFSAEIPVESVQPSDLANLTVELASADTFDRYGLDRPAFLSDFRFEVSETPDGGPVLRLSSSVPVAEPFVTMLLDVRWSSGRLLREYTVLLDPPLFEEAFVQSAVKPAQVGATTQSAAEGQVARSAEPAATEVIEPTGLFQTESPEISPVSEPAREPEPALETAAELEPAPSTPVEPAPSTPLEVEPEPEVSAAVPPVYRTPFSEAGSASVPDSYTTQRGDTLWRISERVRDSTGLSNNQMMLALYRANPDAFMGNINRLKAGAILRIPAEYDGLAPSLVEANSEVVEQNAAWSGSRAQESRLQLVAPAGQDDLESVVESDALAESDASVESGDAEATVTDLDGQTDESKRPLQIEDAELEALQTRNNGEQIAADSKGEVVDGQVDADAKLFADQDAQPGTDDLVEATPESEAAAPGSVGAVPKDESSFLGGILTSFWFWGGVAIVLLLAMMLGRRGKSEPENPAATGSWAADIVEPEHDETVRDFGDLSSNVDSLVVDEYGSAIFADDSDATLDDGEFVAADSDEISNGSSLLDSTNDSVDDSFGSSFGETEDVLGDDLDFRIDPNDAFAAPDSLDQNLDEDAEQQAVGQDEVELPLEKTISTGAPLNLDQADPIAEAEFHMAYGLYDQAADLLVRALANEPDNRLYRVKLLEVFFVWENKDGFLEQARALRDSSGGTTDSDWNKVLILGKQLCPDDKLFSGAETKALSADAMDLELSDVGETEIDFTLGGSEVQSLDLDIGSLTDSDGNAEANGGLDFDFGDELGGIDEGDELALNLGDDSDDILDSSGAATVALDSGDLDLNFGGADGELTTESPTIENPLASPELSDSDATMESDTLERSLHGETLESPTLDAFGTTAETTEMPGLEDPTSLDIDLSGLTDLPVDSDDLLDLPESEASGPVFGDDDSRMSPETANFRIGDEDRTLFASGENLGKVAGDTESGIEENESGSDTVEQPAADDVASGDTAEQPMPGETADLDLADEQSAESFAVDDEAWSLPEDATMTEVGTKLDLARAYIDMGDPDGARSILNEVLDEGEDGQRQEARQLLAELDD